MIHQSVHDVLAAAAPDQEITLVATWTESFDFSAFSGDTSRERRTEMANRIHAGFKRLMLDRLAGVDGLRVRDLLGSRNAILTSTAAVFEDILQRLDWTGIDVEANEIAASTCALESAGSERS